jgi:hypothetical protein
MTTNSNRRGALVLLGMGLGGSAVTSAAGFKADVVAIFQHYCVACHLTGEEPGNLALNPADAYLNLVGRPSIESPLVRVKPDSPEDSYLIRKIEGTHLKAGGKGARMPLGGPVLDGESVAVIRAWIVTGAPES